MVLNGQQTTNLISFTAMVQFLFKIGCALVLLVIVMQPKWFNSRINYLQMIFPAKAFKTE